MPSSTKPTIEEVDQARRTIGKTLDIVEGLPAPIVAAVEEVETAQAALEDVMDGLKQLKGTEELTTEEHAERLYPSN